MSRAGVALSAIGEALQPDQRLRWNYCIDVAGMSPAAVKVTGTTAAHCFAAEAPAQHLHLVNQVLCAACETLCLMQAMEAVLASSTALSNLFVTVCSMLLGIIVQQLIVVWRPRLRQLLQDRCG